MTKLSQILGVSILSLGLVLGLGVLVASAATMADQLQPAGETTNIESLRVGVKDQGGVTFFNGSIVNEGGAVTVADDLRVDGEIYRTEKGGNNPLKISDSVIPTETATNDFGSSDNRWNNGYFTGTLVVGSLGGTGIVSSANILDGTITGSDISSSADLSVGSITATGDIHQSRTSDGAVKALLYVDDDCNILRQWTFDGSTATCTDNGTGQYDIDFDFDVADRFWQATSASSSYSIISSFSMSPGDFLRVYVRDNNYQLHDGRFVLTVY